MELIRLPLSLEQDIRDVIEQSFLHTIAEIEVPEIDYIKKKFKHKKNSIVTHEFPWVVEMGNYYEKLFDVLVDSESKRIILSDESFKIVGGALFYFINPYDVIPDFTKDIGYLDDYYILILCLKHIKGKDRDVVCNRLQLVAK